MKENELLLRGMLSFILIDLISSSIDSITEIILFFVGLEFQLILIVRSIVLTAILIIVYRLLKSVIPVLIKITAKTFTISIILAFLIKYLSSYFRSEMLGIKLDPTIYYSNLVGLDLVVSYLYSFFLIVIVIVKFSQITHTSK